MIVGGYYLGMATMFLPLSALASSSSTSPDSGWRWLASLPAERKWGTALGSVDGILTAAGGKVVCRKPKTVKKLKFQLITLRTTNRNIRTMATTPWTSWWAACGSPQASRSSSTRGSSPPTPPSHQSGFQTAVSTGTNKPSNDMPLERLMLAGTKLHFVYFCNYLYITQSKV